MTDWDDDDWDDDDDDRWPGMAITMAIRTETATTMETTMETETTMTRRKKAGWVNVVYFCEEDNTVWAPGEIWAKGLVNGKGNVNSSEMTTVPEGYKLRVVGRLLL